MKPWLSAVLSLPLLWVAGCTTTSTLKKELPTKRDVTGFVHLTSVWGSDFKPGEPRAIPRLAEAISRFTKIDAEVDDHLLLDSHRILRYPFIYIGVDRGFIPTKNEIKNFGDYLRSGGFALIENMNVGSAEGKGSLKQLVKSALGRGVRFKNLSNRSPIYHSFFDFPDGPPLSPFPSAGTSRVSRYLEGVFLDDRLVVVFCDRAYGRAWGFEYGYEPYLKMGVNLVVFALTQPGSISQQQSERYLGLVP